MFRRTLAQLPFRHQRALPGLRSRALAAVVEEVALIPLAPARSHDAALVLH